MTGNSITNVMELAQSCSKTSLHAVLGANMNDALLRGLSQVRATQTGDTDTRAYIIIFLTDGDPTSGITSSDRILGNVQESNLGTVSIFCLGLGEDADFNFLRKLALQNRGTAHLIQEDNNAAQHFERFYREVESTLLAKIRFSYPGEAVHENTITRTFQPLYFAGSEVRWTWQWELPTVRC